MEITFERDLFNKFLRVMKVIENVCTDCDIYKGGIRQKTNSGFCVIEMDLKKLFFKEGASKEEKDREFCSFSISMLKEKVALLKIFENDDSSNKEDNDDIMGYKDDEKTYIFWDTISEITFRKPDKKFLDNQFINDEKVINKLEGDGDKLLLDYTVESKLARRIRGVCDGFSVEAMKIKVNKDKANFNIARTNNEDFSNIIKNVSLNTIEDGKFEFLIPTFAFSTDANDIQLRVFKTDKSNILLYKFDQNIFDIPVVITGRTEIEKKK